MKPSHRIAFAQDLASFWIQKLSPSDQDRIRAIVLFGSSARREASPDSDLDLFVEVHRATRIERRLRALLEEFLKSVKCTRYWNLLGSIPEIQLVVATATQSETLLPGLLADGITLYGPYIRKPPKGVPHILMAWSGVSSRRIQTNLYRRLYGYRARGTQYPGLVETHRARKVNPGCLLVPLEGAPMFQALFRELEVPVRVQNVSVY